MLKLYTNTGRSYLTPRVELRLLSVQKNKISLFCKPDGKKSGSFIQEKAWILQSDSFLILLVNIYHNYR